MAKTGANNSREQKWRPMLRHPAIDYAYGRFFVTIQAAFNKTIFGAIVGDKCVLNELGLSVQNALGGMGERYSGVKMGEFVVMPNHVHFIVGVGGADFQFGVAGDHVRHGTKALLPLGTVVGRFKSWIAKQYRNLREEGRVADVGATPWQRDYWDKLITNERQFLAFGRYIRENPARWTRDRFGAVTAYTLGNVALLNSGLVAFVASQGAPQAELKPRLLWRKGGGGAPPPRESGRSGPPLQCECGRSGPPSLDLPLRPVISTFASAQERLVLARVLASRRPLVMVCPGGIPEALDPKIEAMCKEGKALLIAPVETGTGINKQRAVWCNEYILRHASEVWIGAITPGRTLDSLIAALRPK